DNEKNTPLHEAANNDHAGIATLLLDNGAEIDARGAASCTPLLNTAWKRSLAVMEVLYQRGADRVAIDRNDYHPILLAAVDSNMMDIV
ncbi:ankyrin repeat protein, partial [Melanomma pulvis-pyrius CBS 109.77]